jgi:hypothetical protein
MSIIVYEQLVYVRGSHGGEDVDVDLRACILQVHTVSQPRRTTLTVPYEFAKAA